MLRTIITAFFLVFIAELGDKTQIQTMLLSTQLESVFGVFIGASLALVLSAFLGVLLGGYITKWIPADYLQIGAGVSFMLIGFLTIIGKI